MPIGSGVPIRSLCAPNPDLPNSVLCPTHSYVQINMIIRRWQIGPGDLADYAIYLMRRPDRRLGAADSCVNRVSDGARISLLWRQLRR
jgi:hypothetical protein